MNIKSVKRCKQLSKHCLFSGITLGLLWASHPVLANQDIDFSWNGYGTLAGGHHDDDAINNLPSPEYNGYSRGTHFDVDSKIALQGLVDIGDKFRLTTQAIALSEDNYEAEIDWAYVTWFVGDDFRIRAGRLQRPSYKYSDFVHVGYAYPWVRPPVEVYSRDMLFFSEIDAINLMYEWKAKDWNLGIETYYGNSSGSAEVLRNETVEYSTRNDMGLSVSGDNNMFHFRMAYQRLPETMIGNTSAVIPLYMGLQAAGFGSIAEDLATDDIEVDFVSLALGMDYNDWLVEMEIVDASTSRSISTQDTAWFLLAGRRLGPFTLSYTYAERKRENNQDFAAPIRAQAGQIAPFDPVAAAQLNGLATGVDMAVDGAVTDQMSQSLGLRYDFDAPLALKAEYQHIKDRRNDLSSQMFSVSVDFFF